MNVGAPEFGGQMIAGLKSNQLIVGLFILMSASAAYAQTPFTVDSATLVVVSGNVGVRTPTPTTNLDVNGNAQFGSGSTKSTFTATGLLQLTSSGIQWADGTTSTTGVSGTAGSACAYNSTRTILATDYTTTATSTGTTIPGASITLTLSQTSRIWIRGFGSLRNNNGGSQTLLSAVVDGIPLTEIGTNAAFCHMIAVGGLENARYWCGIDWTTADTFAPGSHTIDYRMWVTANTGALDCGEARCLFQAQEVCQ